MARVLKLVDKENDVEAGQPVEATSVLVPKAPTPREESEVEVIEASLTRKRTLKKVANAAIPRVVPAIAVNMANFLSNRRRQVPPPSVPRMDAVEAFLSNEPIEAIPVTVAWPALEEPIQTPDGLIPSALGHPLGSNIQHILEKIDMESKESVGMVDHHSGPPNVTVEKAPRKSMSLIPEVGVSSQAVTFKRPRDLIFGEDDRASVSKRPRASEASESESSAEIQPKGAN